METQNWLCAERQLTINAREEKMHDRLKALEEHVVKIKALEDGMRRLENDLVIANNRSFSAHEMINTVHKGMQQMNSDIYNLKNRR